jgi:hypothetical protein
MTRQCMAQLQKILSVQNARLNAIAVLQRMLKSWLEEIHPDMPESEKTEKSLKMDMTLVEAAKEFSVRNILEINNIYRLSLIEMQFIKKVSTQCLSFGHKRYISDDTI